MSFPGAVRCSTCGMPILLAVGTEAGVGALASALLATNRVFVTGEGRSGLVANASAPARHANTE